MKYKLLLKGLQILIYIKRFIWWLGSFFYLILGKIFLPVFKFIGYWVYKINLFVSKTHTYKWFGHQFFRRDNLQVAVLLVLFIIAFPQTKIYGKTEDALSGQRTIAFTFVKDYREFDIEEIKAEEVASKNTIIPSWKEGTISSEDFINTSILGHDQQLPAGIVVDGTALTKPVVFPGTFVGGKRSETIEYIIQPGDTISGIALSFGVSAATILWENNLTLTSFIQPGNKLRILPVNGLTHKVKSGDTLIAIANSYGAKTDEIIKFNKLKSDGSDLTAGESLIIPNGVKQYQATAVATTQYSQPSYNKVSIPPSSRSSPSDSGFIWPSAMRMITQYFSWFHSGVDISGPVGQARGSAIYASKSGVVEVSQCGWNAGYGCYIIIDHGGGYKTLYGHEDALLVSVGQYVETGQTIGLMGNTGRVYGYDGVHIHFEIRINGVTVNPLGYVR